MQREKNYPSIFTNTWFAKSCGIFKLEDPNFWYGSCNGSKLGVWGHYFRISSALELDRTVGVGGGVHNRPDHMLGHRNIDDPIRTHHDSAQRRPTHEKIHQEEATQGGNSIDLELDYNEVAAALENLYKISPCNDDVVRGSNNRKRRRRKKNKEGEIKGSYSFSDEEDDEVEKLVREYSNSSMDLVSMDWKRMKMPPVLSSSEQGRLFRLMQPMKAIFDVKENLHKDLNKEPTEGELAAAMNMTVPQLRRHMEVGQAARNKLIKHNLRLVLFAINKYYREMANGDKFQDLCQAGVKGLITAIDRFEPKRGFRLSTYGLFWIRHSITRSMTTSSFKRVPFGMESVALNSGTPLFISFCVFQCDL